MTADALKSKKVAREPHVPKPDEVAHKKTVEDIQAKINAARIKFESVKEKLATTTSKGSTNDRRNELREQLNRLRQEQADIKQSKESVFQQMNQIEASWKKKVQELKATKEKLTFKTVAEVDKQIKDMEARVELGNLKLIDEKKMLNDISQLKRQRKVVENFQAVEDRIAADKKAYEELKKTIDDSTAKTKSNEYTEIKKELDELSETQNNERDSRQKLVDERNALQQEMDELYGSLRSYREDFKKANDEWYTASRAARERKREEQKREQESIQAAKREEMAQKEREAAETPAFQDEIFTCDNLIRLLSNLAGKAVTEDVIEKKGTHTNIRQVDGSNAPEGVALAKKADRDEEAYFTPKKVKKQSANAVTSTKQSNLKFDLGTLQSFWDIKVDIPLTVADIDKTIEAIQEKKADWVKRSPEATAENIKKAQKKIDDILAGKEEAKKNDVEPTVETAQE